MNLVKSQDYFDPLKVTNRCHIIGCGSVGSTVAELLIRLGLTKISLYDFDVVSAHNLANQMFVNADIKRLKWLSVGYTALVSAAYISLTVAIIALCSWQY